MRIKGDKGIKMLIDIQSPTSIQDQAPHIHRYTGALGYTPSLCVCPLHSITLHSFPVSTELPHNHCHSCESKQHLNCQAGCIISARSDFNKLFKTLIVYRT